MDDEPRGYRSGAGRLGITNLAATQAATSLKNLWSGSTMNCAVNTATTLQFWISGVDDRIACLPSDVTAHHLQGRNGDPTQP